MKLWSQAAGLAAGLFLLLTAARAAPWNLQTDVQTRAELNDNPALAETPAGIKALWSLNLGGSAVYETEAESTQLDLGLNLRAGNAALGRAVESRFALGHKRATPVDSFAANLQWLQDDNLSAQRSASDAALGATRRSLLSASAIGAHQWTERWGGELSANLTQTRYDGANAGNAYRNLGFTAATSYRWDELRRVGVSISHSDYALNDGRVRTGSDSWRLTASQIFSESSSLSGNLGGYKSRREDQFVVTVCPLPESLCNAGLVPREAVQISQKSSSSGAQFNINLDTLLDPVTSLNLTAGRALSAGGLGVTRDDSWGLTVSRNWSDRQRGSLALAQSRSTAPANARSNADNAAPRLTSLDLAWRWAFQTRLSLVAAASAKRFDSGRDAGRASAYAISITLQYQGDRILWNP